MRDDRIEYLIRLVEKSDIAELEITEGWASKIRIAKYATGSAAAAPAAQPSRFDAAVAPSASADTPLPARPEPAEDDNLTAVVAPMVGTFYRASSPETPPFVDVGASVDTGQTLCIIEAMKIMNEIASEVRGSVRKVLVENGQPVEFGQTLFLIEKSA